MGDSRFEAWCGGQLIVARTREPLLEGARALLAAGYHPDTIAVMRHAGSDVDVLTARIGTAARFYVEESGHGPVLRSVRKPPPGAVDRPPIAQTRPAGAEHRRGGRAGIDCRFRPSSTFLTSKKAGSPPASPVIPVTGSNAESGIEISGRRYVSARHVASMLGVSLRNSFPLERDRRRPTENQDRQKGLLRPRQASGMVGKSRNPTNPYHRAKLKGEYRGLSKQS